MSEPLTDAGAQTIELDCAPGTPRPDTYLPGILEGTGIPVREPVGKCFGNWTWDYRDIAPEVWNAANLAIGERITNLYHRGRIRYGSW